MSMITALEPQQRRAGRTNVYVDGRFLIGVSDEVVLRMKLRVGEPIDGDRLREVAAAEDLHRATDVALRYLETRPRTQKEIETRLARDGYGEDVAEKVVEKLIALGLIDDAQFAAQWIEAKTRLTGSRPAGKRRLTSDLYRKGVDKDTIEEAVASVDEDAEIALARAALRGRLKTLPTDPEALFAEKRRLASFLARRGFGWDTVSKVLREIAPDE
jgi:regulatory protein